MSEGAEDISSLIRGVMGEGGLQRTLGKNQRAALAWYSVNGRVEREHTTGVFVKEARMPGRAPVLGVYVDSRMRAVDFRANREIYIVRLSMAGHDFSDIEFFESRYEKGRPSRDARARQATPPRPLPELAPDEVAACREQTAALPDGIRERVFKAMCLSKQREKLAGTSNE